MGKFIFPLVMGILLICGSSWAVPRYSAMYGQSCALCHIDPSGGGARSLYGAQYFAHSELPVKTKSFEKLGEVQPQLSDQVQIGFDGRTMFFGTDEPSVNSFMQMQGDLYLIFQASPQWAFYLDKGLYEGFEAWGLGHILPNTGYIKVGKFTPPYGLQLADHKAFVREKLGFAYNSSETGIEVGFHPERYTIALAVTNGTTAFQDGDEAKAVTGRTDLRLPLGDLNFWLGATGRYNEIAGEQDMIVGGFGGIALGNLFFLWEVDYRDYLQTELVTFAEIALKVHRGITLKVEHDFYDPDLDYESGADNMYLIGAEIVPTGFLQLIPDLRYYDVGTGNGENFFEGSIQFHFFY